MAKRGANTELNHDNWDEDEEPEEAGTFAQADKSTLKDRVIKKAKRRGIAQNVSERMITITCNWRKVTRTFTFLGRWSKYFCWFWWIQVIRRHRGNDK